MAEKTQGSPSPTSPNTSVASSSHAAPSQGSGVELKDANGVKTGVIVDLGPGKSFSNEEDPNGHLAAASRIVGWNNMNVNGAAIPYSSATALDLLNRFPHWARQIGGVK